MTLILILIIIIGMRIVLIRNRVNQVRQAKIALN